MNSIHEIIKLGQSVEDIEEMELSVANKILELNLKVRISDIQRVNASSRRLFQYYVEAAQLLSWYLSETGQERLSGSFFEKETAVRNALNQLKDKFRKPAPKD